MNDITLNEAMKIIDDYIEEKSHDVSLDGLTKDKVRGTAARIAFTKAVKHREAVSHEAKPTKKIVNAGKTVADVVNGVNLSNGVKKNIDKANEIAQKTRDEFKKIKEDDVTDPKKSIDKVGKITKSSVKELEKLNKKTQDEVDHLRALKRKYIPATESVNVLGAENPKDIADVVGPGIAAGAATAGSAIGLSTVKKELEKVKAELENEIKAKDPDKSKIRKLKIKVKKLTALKAFLTGSTAAGATLAGKEALRLGLSAYMAHDMKD